MKPAEADCYRLIQQIALQQDPVCIFCRRPSGVGHHLFKRDRLNTAFLPEAVRGLCNSCHGAVHANPAFFKAKIVKLIGERYFEMERLSKQVCADMDFKAVRKVLMGKMEAGDCAPAMRR